MPRSADVAIALPLVLAAIAAGYALYSDVEPTGAVSGSQPQEWTAMDTEPPGEPLRVANPFDSTEVFEFPAGTSEAEAQEAVAAFLIERATRRGSKGLTASKG
jgi:hypothetical protein